MQIQDAIKSGKPFKTPTMIDHLFVKADPITQVEFFYWLKDNTRCNLFPVSSIVAKDWEILEVPDNVLSFPIKPIPPNRPTDSA